MRHFFASVAGESYRNRDGSDRQAIISGCRVGEPLGLVAEPDNPHDENAIKVLREDGKQLGYLEAGLAARFTAEGFGGYYAFVAGIGRGGGGYYGVALLIVVGGNDDDDAVARYATCVLEREGNPATMQRRHSRTDNSGVDIGEYVVPVAIGLGVGAAILAGLFALARW